MIRAFGFLYITNKEDWEKHYNKQLGRIDHVAVRKVPHKFPVCFRYQEDWDPKGCGWWIPCDKNELVSAFKKDITNSLRLLKIIEGTE